MYYLSQLTGNYYKEENSVYTEVPKDDLNAVYLEMINSGQTIQKVESLPFELIEIEKLKKIDGVKKFLSKNKTDGRAYFNQKELEITLLLAGMLIIELIPISEEIEIKIYPFLNLIKSGDYFNCMMKFYRQDIPLPENQIVLNLYNEVKAYSVNYFNENYPNEAI